jgi:hypothetical protein
MKLDLEECLLFVVVDVCCYDSFYFFVNCGNRKTRVQSLRRDSVVDNNADIQDIICFA